MKRFHYHKEFPLIVIDHVGSPDAVEHRQKSLDSVTSGKYMIFSDDFMLLSELAEFLMIKFELGSSKISETKKRTTKGFGHILCVYDYEQRLKTEINDALYEFFPATRETIEDDTYPFNYRYWKSDNDSLREAGKMPKSNIKEEDWGAGPGPNIVHVPEVILTNRGLESGIDVFARAFEQHMNNKMMDHHPEIFDEDWENFLNENL